MPDITVSYKGNTIGTIDATGRHTVDAQGYYMEDDVTIDYVKPGGSTPSLTNLIQNGDFSVQGATTNGWSSLNSNATIAVIGGKLVLTHTITSNRAYGFYYNVNTIAGHSYFIKYKFTKTIVDDDIDARGVILNLAGTTTNEITRRTGLTQNTVVESVTAITATGSNTKLEFRFLGNISTAASNDSMLELWYVEMYDITDVIP